MSVAASTSPARSISPSTAFAAVVASGLPPNVLPCCPRWNRSDASPNVMSAPIGTPPAMPFATAMASGTMPVLLEVEPAPGATGAGLDLVEDQQCAVLRRELAGRLEVAGGQLEHAGLALDGLDEERGDRVIHGGLERLDRRIDVLDAGQQRKERLAHRGLRRSATANPWCGRGTRSSSARILRATLVEPGQLDGGLDGLGARVAEVDAPAIARAAEALEPLGELDLGRRREVVGDVREGRDLAAHGIHQHRMRVARAN